MAGAGQQRSVPQLKVPKEIFTVNEPAIPPNPFAEIAPALAHYTDNVLFGDVWKRPGLSPRDRSLVTVTCLVALYRVNELPFHLKRALENGVTRDEWSDCQDARHTTQANTV